MRIYSKTTRRNLRYYLRIMTANYRSIDWWTLAAGLALILCLLVWPKSAAAGDMLYLPYASSDAKDWFDQTELDAAQAAAGYDPVVAMYTWCELDDSAQPPAIIRYRLCHQDLTPAIQTDGWAVLYWYSPGLARMVWMATSHDTQR